MAYTGIWNFTYGVSISFTLYTRLKGYTLTGLKSSLNTAPRTAAKAGCIKYYILNSNNWEVVHTPGNGPNLLINGYEPGMCHTVIWDVQYGKICVKYGIRI